MKNKKENKGATLISCTRKKFKRFQYVEKTKTLIHFSGTYTFSVLAYSGLWKEGFPRVRIRLFYNSEDVANSVFEKLCRIVENGDWEKIINVYNDDFCSATSTEN